MTSLQNWLRPAACALALLTAAPSPGPSPASSPASSPADEGPRPALWKLADADTTIWLFGTIHILPRDVPWYAGPVASAFEASGELVTEIPVDQAKDSQAVILRRAMREDGRELRATLGRKERVAYERAMASVGLPAQVFDSNDTWFAALMLTLIPLRTAGYNLESGVDAQVGAKAQAKGMVNTALESAEYQITLFDTLPARTQRRYLSDVIAALPTVRKDIDAMVAAWEAGKADDLARLMNEQEDDPALRKVLLIDRNKAWADWLGARMDRPGTVFMAVGAGHLAGRGSVQDQLARIGVKSVRVQ